MRLIIGNEAEAPVRPPGPAEECLDRPPSEIPLLEREACSIQLLTIEGGSIAALTKFFSRPLFRAFGLPGDYRTWAAPRTAG